MERKFTAASSLITALCLMSLIALFMLRSRYCNDHWPNMKTEEGEWDGSNTFTMNIFALMFFLSFLLTRTYKYNLVNGILLDILIAVAGCDLFDRIIFKIVNPDEKDFFTFIVIVIVVLIDQIIIKKCLKIK